MSTTTIDMSSNGPYVALPKLRMQCGLPPTMEDTSYPSGGKKCRKGNALRRMQRRNAAIKRAKAQDDAGSPQEAEEPPKAGVEVAGKDAEGTSESSEKDLETMTPPCEGGASFDEQLSSISSAKAEEKQQQPVRRPKSQLAQIEAILRTMSPNNQPPTRPQGNRRTNFRGTHPKIEDSKAPNAPPKPTPTTPSAGYLPPPDTSCQRASSTHHSVASGPQGQVVTMDASKPEADPVHVHSASASTALFPVATNDNTDSQHSWYQNTSSTADRTTARTTPNMHNTRIASPNSLVTSGATDLGVKSAVPFIKPQPSVAGAHTQITTSPPLPSSHVQVSLLNASQKETTPEQHTTIPQVTAKPPSPLKREYDSEGNYIPPHMRKPKQKAEVQPAAKESCDPLPLRELPLNLNTTPVSPTTRQESILKPVSNSKDHKTVTESASAMAGGAHVTHVETKKPDTISAGKPPSPEASAQTPHNVPGVNEAGRDEVTLAPEVVPVVQDIIEKATVESVTKQESARFQTPPGSSKETRVDQLTTGPGDAVARAHYGENITQTVNDPPATTRDPNPRTPQKSKVFKNSAGSPGASPFAGPSKQPGTRRQSPFAKISKQAGKQPPVDFVWDDRKAKWSYNSDFGGTEGPLREIEDDDDGLKLQDWDGNWMPAPVEWDARPSFNNVSAKFAASVHKWVEEESAQAVSVVDMNQRAFLEGVALGTGTERVWEMIPEEDQGDTQLYPEDDYTPTKLEQTSAASITAYTAQIEVKEKEQKADRKAIRAAHKAHRETYVPPPNLHVPKANIFIRPAHVGDLNQIKDIYAWYISNTVVAPEREVLDRTAWQNRMQDVEDCKLPFLVAVTRNNRNNRPNRRFANSREVIVGFGFADLFAGQFDAFKYAVEMQVFVHHQHKRFGIGKTLVDRLLTALDPQHMSRNGTDFFAENTLDYEQGGRRIVGRILATIPYDPTDDQDFQWQTKWLAEWDFDLVATLPKIGYKRDKFLNFAYLMKQTGVTIGPGCGM